VTPFKSITEVTHPQCNVTQTVSLVQYSVTDLNDVTEKDQIKHELRK